MAGSGSGSETQMRDTDLFQAALGLGTPWSVSGSRFDAVARRLDIEIAFAKGARFACPTCGAAGCPAYDTEQLTWRHLSFFQHEAYLTARVPRVSCQACGIRQVSVPWARAGSGCTLLFEAFVMALVASMPVAVVARTVGEHDTKLWRVVHHYVEQARDHADHGEVRRVAFDETASRRGHNYVSLFVDLDCAQVLFVADGKELAVVRGRSPALLGSQLFFAGAQCHGMSSSMRLCGQPLTSRVSRSVR